MGLLLTAIKLGFKAVDVGLGVAVAVDSTVTKVKRWNKQRKFEKARKARLIKEIRKS